MIEQAERFQPYLDELRALVEADELDIAAVAPHLDGLAGLSWRRTVPRLVRREQSTFFTGSVLRYRLIAPHAHLLRAGTCALDPSCGLGDLLLEAARHVPVERVWEQVHGLDLLPPLVAAARLRLRLQLRSAVGTCEAARRPGYDRAIRVGDALAEYAVDWASYGLLLLNPPFATGMIPPDQRWGSGRTTQAASFLLHCLRNARPGALLAAVLPDALRGGHRYRRWREEVGRLADVDSVESIGRFDPGTDVDVFIARMRVLGDVRDAAPAGHREGWGSSHVGPEPVMTVADCWHVRVGAVVPHRHRPAGPSVPYLTGSALPIGEELPPPATRIQHAGRTHQPPFVVVQRTSSPSQRHRVRGAIVTGSAPVAVENHLLVFEPLRGDSIAGCRELLAILHSPTTQEWIDQRSRCRHLPATLLRQLPLRPP